MFKIIDNKVKKIWPLVKYLRKEKWPICKPVEKKRKKDHSVVHLVKSHCVVLFGAFIMVSFEMKDAPLMTQGWNKIY